MYTIQMQCKFTILYTLPIVRHKLAFQRTHILCAFHSLSVFLTVSILYLVSVMPRNVHALCIKRSSFLHRVLSLAKVLNITCISGI